MIETKNILVSNIIYKGREKYLSVCGAGQLENFISNSSMSCYDAQSAPREIKVSITADFDNIDDIIEKALLKAEEELGLSIKSFRVSY